MLAHFSWLAAYNRWANDRLYTAAQWLPKSDVRRPVGAYFDNLLGTLNHLLVTDRVWLSRLEGANVPPKALSTTAFADLDELAQARRAEDERLVRWFDGKDDVAVAAYCTFRMMNGQCVTLRTSQVLSHLFNHQTHHRGQAHTCLTILSAVEPPVLDLLAFALEPCG